jgi:hypothetical protein
MLNSHSGTSNITTLSQRRSGGSVLGTYYDEPRLMKKVVETWESGFLFLGE